MSISRHAVSAISYLASDVATWHPDLEVLVRYDLPFICFDTAGAALHISPTATRLLAATTSIEALFEALRDASGAALGHRNNGTAAAPCSRRGARVADPSTGDVWLVHSIRTRHEWCVAVAVSESAQPQALRESVRERLTRRELQVASLVAEGEPAKGVAAQLEISVHTARRHTEQVFRKLGVHSRAELTRVVMRAGDILRPLNGGVRTVEQFASY